jgi:hypothetical protein
MRFALLRPRNRASVKTSDDRNKTTYVPIVRASKQTLRDACGTLRFKPSKSPSGEATMTLVDAEKMPAVPTPAKTVDGPTQPTKIVPIVSTKDIADNVTVHPIVDIVSAIPITTLTEDIVEADKVTAHPIVDVVSYEAVVETVATTIIDVATFIPETARIEAIATHIASDPEEYAYYDRQLTLKRRCDDATAESKRLRADLETTQSKYKSDMDQADVKLRELTKKYEGVNASNADMFNQISELRGIISTCFTDMRAANIPDAKVSEDIRHLYINSKNKSTKTKV